MHRFAPVALLVAVAVSACGATATADRPVVQNTAVSASGTPDAATPTPETTPTPSPSDYELRVKILRKQCFGSAGCNVDYSIRVTYSGLPMPEDATYRVTYKVTGGEDEMINTFEITGDQVTVTEEESVSTPSSASKLRAKVTEIELA